MEFLRIFIPSVAIAILIFFIASYVVTEYNYMVSEKRISLFRDIDQDIFRFNKEIEKIRENENLTLKETISKIEYESKFISKDNIFVENDKYCGHIDMSLLTGYDQQQLIFLSLFGKKSLSDFGKCEDTKNCFIIFTEKGMYEDKYGQYKCE